MRIRATDAVGHITESQLVIHIVEEDEAPPVVRGLAVIDDEGYVSMGSEGALIIKVYRTILWPDFWLQWKVNFTETSKTTFNNDQQGKKLLGKTGWMGWLGW